MLEDSVEKRLCCFLRFQHFYYYPDLLAIKTYVKAEPKLVTPYQTAWFKIGALEYEQCNLKDKENVNVVSNDMPKKSSFDNSTSTR